MPTPTTADEYLAGVQGPQRELVDAVVAVVRTSLPEGYEERMQWGTIGWSVPLSLYPAGYHTTPGTPLPYASVAARKSGMSLYLMGLYTVSGAAGETNETAWFGEAWRATGRKLDMGKSCVRLKRLEDAALDVIGEAIARIPVARYIAAYEQVLGRAR
ncbi:MAG: DUF1801 domain-containing protein [Gaiellales bacterium]